MRLVGCLLLLSGFFLVLAALVLLTAQVRFAFVAAALGVEVLGVGLLTRAYTQMQKERK